MGATLPAIARWVETTPSGVSWLGYFYGGNIAGAVVGMPARRLLPAARVRHADRHLCRRGAQRRWSALLALGIARVTAYAPAADSRPAGPVESAESRLVYVAIALSGMTALGAEVVWTRHPLAALRRDDLHVLADPRGVPRRTRPRQHGRRPSWRDGSRSRASCWDGASSCCAPPSPGPRTRWATRCRTGRSTRRSRPIRGSTSSSI